jgi:uncharacterized protein YacL
MADRLLLRSIFVLILAACAVLLRPFSLSPLQAILFSLAAAAAVFVVELRLKKLSLPRLTGGAAGAIAGLLAAALLAFVLKQSVPDSAHTAPFLQLASLLLLTYLGGLLGAAKLEGVPFTASAFAHDPAANPSAAKILDTSVIIDGRIADILQTGFLDGLILIPQFVLRELQAVADSADSLKRNRGRRGLDILQHIQKQPHLQIRIVEEDFPHIREVDVKLIELARRHQAKIITNDFNLNKVAQLQGVGILNINELANAMRPVVLPGEVMRVFILKEGKEPNQGIAYLDDGTMVVVDNARRMISKTIDIAVSSVLQTPAGKMIFARFDDRLHAVHDTKGA